MPCRDLNSLKPEAKKACELFLNECKKKGLTVGVCETLRTAEYQNELYQKGRTIGGSIVTNCDGHKNKSEHQSGMAFDFFQNIKGKEWDKPFYDKACPIAKRLGLDSGYYWTSFKDNPHITVPKNWKAPSIDELEDAVNILHKKGVINTPASWNTLDAIEKSKKYIHELIANFMKSKFDVKVCCYNDSIVGLYQQGIISDLSVWTGLELPSANNIRFLLIKMGKVM